MSKGNRRNHEITKTQCVDKLREAYSELEGRDFGRTDEKLDEIRKKYENHIMKFIENLDKTDLSIASVKRCLKAFQVLLKIRTENEKIHEYCAKDSMTKEEKMCVLLIQEYYVCFRLFEIWLQDTITDITLWCARKTLKEYKELIDLKKELSKEEFKEEYLKRVGDSISVEEVILSEDLQDKEFICSKSDALMLEKLMAEQYPEFDHFLGR